MNAAVDVCEVLQCVFVVVVCCRLLMLLVVFVVLLLGVRWSLWVVVALVDANAIDCCLLYAVVC